MPLLMLKFFEKTSGFHSGCWTRFARILTKWSRDWRKRRGK